MNRWLDVKSFFRFLGKNRFYTLINVFGLSVSLMFVILITVYTTQELSVDTFQEKADRIYILGNEAYPGSAWKLGSRLKERYPEIEQVCSAISEQKSTPVEIIDRRVKADLLFADSTFFDVFSFELVSGDRQRAIAATDGAVISESFARRVFPDTDPLGQTLRMYDSLEVTVRGVMKDIRRSAIPYADILLRIENVDHLNQGLSSERFSNYGTTLLFLLERENANLRAREADILEWFKEIVWLYRDGHAKQVVLVPLREIYFSDRYPMFKGAYNGWIVNFGDRSLVMILMWAGILILLFAVINYINLTTAQAGFRAKEMAMRRLLGSSRGELFTRLMMESTLLCLLSFIVGLTLAAVAAPYAGQLVERSLDLAGAVTPLSVAMAAGVILVLGAVSGLLPAMVISNAKPIEIVRGGFRRRTKMVFSKGFITFQNAVTIALIAASITMIAQVKHLINAPLGYRTENLITINFSHRGEEKNDKRLFAEELKRLPMVKRTGFSAGTPFNRGNNHTMKQDGKQISFQHFVCDEVFFEMIGWEKLRDNQVSGEAYYLNERALKELEIGEDAPTFLYYGKPTPIAGVLRDFQLHNISTPPSPVMVQVRKLEEFEAWQFWNLTVEVEGHPGKAYRAVKEVYERIFRSEFDGEFIDQQVAASFDAERRTSRLLMLFTAVAILISLLGLLAMSTYFIRLRAKEIAIRKVFGSTNPEALRRLVSTFLSYVLVAFVVAAPVTWFLMQRWLSGYASRIRLSPWIFVAAGLFCLLVSFVTVFFQSYAAANANPVKNIKTE
ncbi:MAG: ABC transporter permease [Tannerella sp.]|jgi:putative ABC transport system permease protein|nr:ABC transporter permease [Tannerella sp.]